MLCLVPAKDVDQKDHEIRTLSSARTLERGWQAIDTTMLALDFGSSFLVKQQENSSVVRLIQPKIDPTIIKEWLRYCQDNHSGACSAGNDLLPSDTTASPITTIPSFRFIDCETRQVVNGFHAPYVALSYVWGEGSTGPDFSRKLPLQLPQTIEDAMVVTRSLDLQYLWIDRYCINQSDPSEKQEQVAQMDLIYNCAYLTIIAAAGKTPVHGLPGVGHRDRKAQPHGIVQGHMLVSTLPDPRYSILNSQWSQRGWTYQEGILSHRRLIFTDEQVYFECSGMYCCEALNFPLQNLHTRDRRRFRAKFCTGNNIGLFSKGTGTSAWEIVERIEEYSTRQLTNPSDILNGISGILQAFARSKKRILHCAGVPMIPTAPPGRYFREKKLYRQEWSPTLGLCEGLCWGLRSPAKRRQGFPSWSWTGWQRDVQWEIDTFDWPFLELDKDLQISIQLVDGELVDLQTFCRRYDDLNKRISDTLHVATWAFPLLVWRTRKFRFGGCRCEAIVKLEDMGICLWEFRPTRKTPLLPSSACFGIPLCHASDEEPGRKLYVLVVQEVESETYERVGFGRMGEHDIRAGKDLSDPDNWSRGLRNWGALPTPKKAWKEFRIC